MKHLRGKTRRTSPLLIICLIAALVVFCFSLWKIVSILYRDYQSETAFDDLAQRVSSASQIEESSGEEQGILPEYRELARENPDLVGWLKIDGTKINYPVMATPTDPQFYLRRNFQKNYDYSGTPFLDYRCDAGLPSTNLVIYGHCMKNGGMFGQLEQYKEKEFFTEHPIIQFDTLYERRTYEIAAVILTQVPADGEEGFRYYDFIQAQSQEEFDGFIRSLRETDLYETGITPQYGDELITLSTCSYHTQDGRLAVIARRVS